MQSGETGQGRGLAVSVTVVHSSRSGCVAHDNGRNNKKAAAIFYPKSTWCPKLTPSNTHRTTHRYIKQCLRYRGVRIGPQEQEVSHIGFNKYSISGPRLDRSGNNRPSRLEIPTNFEAATGTRWASRYLSNRLPNHRPADCTSEHTAPSGPSPRDRQHRLRQPGRGLLGGLLW